MSCSRAEPKVIEYMSPMQLFRETKRKAYKRPVFLGFSFTEEHVTVTVSNNYCDFNCSEFPRDGTLLDKLVGKVQKCVEEYHLRGIIVDRNNLHKNSVENIRDLMDKICKKGNFKSLKYTCWKDDIATNTPRCECNQFGTLFWGITIRVQPSELQELWEALYARQFLRRFTYIFNYLYMVEYEEMEDEFEEMEDEYEESEDDEDSEDVDEEWEEEDLEREEEEDSERKMINYLKPLQFFREIMERDYYMPPVFVLVSFNDGYAFVAISDDWYLNARTYGVFPIGETLLDKLADKVEEYELVGIIVEDNKSVDIHNLMDDLCKKGNFKSFKYTCWKDDIASTNPTFECNKFGSLFWGITLPVEHSELQKHLEVLSAQHMLQTFLDFFKILYIDKDREIEDKDEKREDSKKKAVQDNPVKVLYRAPSVCVKLTY